MNITNEKLGSKTNVIKNTITLVKQNCDDGVGKEALLTNLHLLLEMEKQ